MKSFARWGVVGVLLGVSLLTVIPLLKPGLFDVHDPTSLLRFFALRQTLSAGQIPAAWNNSLNNGFGYPIFLYYAPLFTYLGALFSWLTPTYLIALKLMLVIVVLISAIGMYRLIAKYGRVAALVASCAYTFLPYHASTLYVRGSYSEAMTWAILPWLLYFWRLPMSNKKRLISLSVITALFFLSHNVLPFFFLPALIVWILIFQRQALARVMLVTLFTLGLSSWFLIPVIFERHFVQADVIATKTHITDHFITPSQLWHSDWGFAGSAALGQADGMSFMLGKFHLVLAVITLIGIILFRRQFKTELIFFLFVAIIYAYLTTTLSSPLWGLAPTLAIIQFPWRLLGLSGVGLAALAGLGFTQITHKWLRWGMGAVVVILFIYFNFKFFTPERFSPYTDQNFINDHAIASTVKDKIPEYLPASMPQFPEISSNDGFNRTATAVSGQINLNKSAPLLIETAYMPQWVLTVDNQITPIQPNEQGLISTVGELPAGEHQFMLTWERTMLENGAILFTIVTILAMIGLPI